MKYVIRSFVAVLVSLPLSLSVMAIPPFPAPQKTTVEVVEAPDKLEAKQIAIVGISADGHVAKSPVRAFVHDPVTLHAVVKGREDGHEIAVTDAAVIAAGAVPWAVPARTWTKPEETRVTWFKVEPKGREYWNMELPSMHFSFKKVPYLETAVQHGSGTLVADAKPTTNDRNPDGFGTMRFKVEYRRDAAAVATAGASAMQPTHQDNLFRVSYAGVTRFPLINAALELCNVPYVFGSETFTQREEDHQSEWAYGVDCADLVSYAIRHAGISFPYGFTGTFDPAQGRTGKVARPVKVMDGVYVDAAGKPIRWGAGGVQPQDLVLFDGKQRHIGILFEDHAPYGVLDEGDLIVHTLCEAPCFVKIGEAYDESFAIVRLKKNTGVLAAAPSPLPRGEARIAVSPPAKAAPAKTSARPVGERKSGG